MTFSSHPFALTCLAAQAALRDEVEPEVLREIAEQVWPFAAHLATRLEAKAERGVELRVMLALALIGELDPDV